MYMQLSREIVTRNKSFLFSCMLFLNQELSKTKHLHLCRNKSAILWIHNSMPSNNNQTSVYIAFSGLIIQLHFPKYPLNKRPHIKVTINPIGKFSKYFPVINRFLNCLGPLNLNWFQVWRHSRLVGFVCSMCSSITWIFPPLLPPVFGHC